MRATELRYRVTIALVPAVVGGTGCALVLDFEDYELTLALARPPSCNVGGPGAGNDCGSTGTDDCCAALPVEGGTYSRPRPECASDAPATVSGFYLDKYEVTIGRFRAFVEAYKPEDVTAGIGAHPAHPESGWQADWVPPSKADIIDGMLTNCSSLHLWTNDVDPSGDKRPINCVRWDVAFLFCAWDGGRLPTEAEWYYAATGGANQWTYPWGMAAPDSELVVYDCPTDMLGAGECIQPVGSKPRGEGLWQQLDLAGNVAEWNLDGDPDLTTMCDYPPECTDCVQLTEGIYRIHRGGHYADGNNAIRADSRGSHSLTAVNGTLGVRCARDAPR